MTKMQGSLAVLLASLAGCPGPGSDVTLTDRPQPIPVDCAADGGVDDQVQLQLRPKQLKLWPPNHKLHAISVADCVEIVGACPGDQLSTRFVWASSDEPEDAKGDGNHSPDIVLSDDCQQLSLRSERQGPSDGRVYTLGVQLVDATGEVHEAACTVSVDHDQSGRVATAGADAYRLVFDGKTAGIPNCHDDADGDDEVDEEEFQ